jgi:hypothetical protein
MGNSVYETIGKQVNKKNRSFQNWARALCNREDALRAEQIMDGFCDRYLRYAQK